MKEQYGTIKWGSGLQTYLEYLTASKEGEKPLESRLQRSDSKHEKDWTMALTLEFHVMGVSLPSQRYCIQVDVLSYLQQPKQVMITRNGNNLGGTKGQISGRIVGEANTR
jgi:hypothetical protein